MLVGEVATEATADIDRFATFVTSWVVVSMLAFPSSWQRAALLPSFSLPSSKCTEPLG
jgi:hypothetical protein